MATTALITVEDIGIYKHYDGYTSSMMPWLEDFHRDFLKNGGWDPSCELAQLLRDSIRSKDEYNGLDDDHYNGWGIVKTEKYTTNYKYVLCRKSIKVYRFNYDMPDYFLIDTLPIKFRKVEKTIQEKITDKIFEIKEIL